MRAGPVMEFVNLKPLASVVTVSMAAPLLLPSVPTLNSVAVPPLIGPR